MRRPLDVVATVVDFAAFDFCFPSESMVDMSAGVRESGEWIVLRFRRNSVAAGSSVAYIYALLHRRFAKENRHEVSNNRTL